MMGEAVEVWRGGPAPLDCDGQGRACLGFYLATAMESLVGLAAELGMPQAFTPHAEATLIVREQHLQLQRPAGADAALRVEADVLALGENDARIRLVLRHDDSEPAATFGMGLVHATSREGRPFPWPERIRARAAQLRLAAADRAASPQDAPSLPRDSESGSPRIGLGAVRPGDVDAFGRMQAERLLAPIERLTPFVMEHRIVHREWPRVGDRIAIWADPAHRTFWLEDPNSGRTWAWVQYGPPDR